MKIAGLLAVCLGWPVASAADRHAWPDPASSSAPPPATSSAGLSDSALNFRGIFNSELPGIERKYRLKLVLHPHIGDFTKYDYLRTAVGLRYGVSSHLEVSGETNTYFGTGLRDVGFFKEAGLVDARFGFKYRTGRRLLPGWDSGLGMSYTVPLSNPPPQLTDGFRHLRPFISFARPLERHPNWRVFWKLGADLITPTDIQGKHEKNDLTEDANSFGAGFIWHRGNVHYTLEAGYETTRLLSKVNEDVFMIRPGFVWEIPRRHTRSSRSQWLLGLALTLSDGPDGVDVGVGGKLKVDLDLKRLWRRSSAPSDP